MTTARPLLALLSLGLMSPLFAAEDTIWNNTLDRISSGVVSIRVDSTRAFDTEWNSSSQATGFVVDAERGLILTNRHVVTPGPVVAEAVLRPGRWWPKRYFATTRKFDLHPFIGIQCMISDFSATTQRTFIILSRLSCS